MDGKKFYSLITTAGLERLADAAVSGEPVGFALMAVGDGNGQLPVPYREQSGLVSEVYRSALNGMKITDAAANVIEAEMLIPPQVGGFTMREAALYDEDGVCLAVANMPETYKPLLAEGSGRFSVIRIQLAVASTADVQLLNDPGVVVATVEDVIKVGSETRDYTDNQLSEHAKSRNHPDATLKEKGFTRLSNAINSDSEELAATPKAIKAAIASAVRSAWELDNPVGTTRFFSQNLDPNERWPWSQWVYTGENKSIRVGKADGSDVGQTGGSDTVTLQKANLPAAQIDVSGETSEQQEQKLKTTRGGVHNHGGVAGKDDPWEIGGDVRQLFNPKELGVTDDAGEHDHEVTVPPHKHSTSGKTANLGEGKSFSVVEAHTLLMCWSRVA
ncbi:TPA: phage tail protein [Klebsiella pneumoniae]|uniref:phage tail protein n=1 Tax=Klebsiella pneumoniae TaxID=573 RepID=UPI000E2DC0FE|nr:phage tail protein [Klebsiella pneumoniae]HDS4583370.1 phage tail protein [Klebsiella pneumoniae subsp. pneumoniae]EIX9334334.1 phage tail protein [Klebsiella pneumoniae]EIX9437427.1 phage tail protein [Klebsiella pneumoniae]EKW8316462.1 phage tail protein [Klebsiella pneumoniae]ELA0059485.1 phage tail protein [Klebsiella pneumoniae]